MENENNFSESIICTGSDMNHRTFREDESWNSLQSTILAGQFSINTDSDISDKKNNLTTLNEENSLLSKEESEFESINEDENMLNMNLDAISDDVFFDCQNISNSKIQNELNSPFKVETPSKKFQISSNKQLLTVNVSSPANNESTTDSGLDEEKTGALLVQIVEDFKDMKDHAQSTPKFKNENKHLSPTTGTSKNLKLMSSVKNNNNVSNVATSLKIMTNVNSETKNCTGKRTLNCLTSKNVKRIKSPCYKQYSPVDRTNKENFFAGKYSGGVNVVSKANPNVLSPLEKKPRRVAQIKEFFENQSKIYDQTYNRKFEGKAPVKKIGPRSILHLTKSPQMRNTRSPSYHTQETFKLLKTSKAFKSNSRNVVTFNSSATTSFLIRNQAQNTSRSRPSSCSEFITESSANCNLSRNDSVSIMNKSKSMGDLSHDSVKYLKLLHAREMKMITKRPYLSVNQCMSLFPKSPKSQKVSDIMKRKSFGYVSSPVKPVKELRKIFSPSGVMNVNQVKKRSSKKPGTLQIIISKE